jgi:hypothetical protein
LAISTELVTASLIFLSNHFSILKLKIINEKIAIIMLGIPASDIK